MHRPFIIISQNGSIDSASPGNLSDIPIIAIGGASTLEPVELFSSCSDNEKLDAGKYEDVEVEDEESISHENTIAQDGGKEMSEAVYSSKQRAQDSLQEKNSSYLSSKPLTTDFGIHTTTTRIFSSCSLDSEASNYECVPSCTHKRCI